MKSRTRAGLLLSAGAAATVLTMVVAPTAAVAAQSTVDAAAAASTIEAGKKAKISAKGAALRVPITYKCNAGWEGYLNLQVVEVVDDGFASGSASRSISCSGAEKTVNVYLQASAYQGAEPFEPGAASLLGSLDTYDPINVCGSYDPYGCAVEGAKPADPPAGTIFTSSSLPSTGHSIEASGSAHSEVQGTITLVK